MADTEFVLDSKGVLHIVQRDTCTSMRLGNAEQEVLYDLLRNAKEEAYIERRLKETRQRPPIEEIDI